MGELDDELAALNAAVDEAVARRRQWMDDHMADYARYRVGEKLYDLGTGRLLGTIEKLYRYWANHDPSMDTRMSVDYAYRTRDGFIDNTSRHGRGSYWYGNKQELLSHLERQRRYVEETE